MKSKIEIPQDILVSIDFANTVHGGMSEITLNVQRNRAGYEIAVRVPGLQATDFEVDVLNGRLLVYQLLSVFGQPTDLTTEPTKSMRVLGNFYLPNDADFARISARYDQESRQLWVQMPFNNDVKDARWHIDVEQ